MSIPSQTMITEVVAVDPDNPQGEILARAGELLRRGGVVAFPTETVYGLGANALSSEAVAEIFRVKGRPAANPLIVHVADRSQLADVVADWPLEAEKLAEQFWPGPLTMILPKVAGISDLVTAGGPTVAVRMPAHPVAAGLIRSAGLPLAAPSANRSTELSPTRAEHVFQSLAGWIPLILDAGRTHDGIESTVIDLTTRPATLLRPGPISPAVLEAVIGPLARGREVKVDEPLRSPGMTARHYAPRTPLICLRTPHEAYRFHETSQKALLRVGWVFDESMADRMRRSMTPQRVLAADSAGYAAALYETLHDLDRLGLDRIIVMLPDENDEWLAVRDRLQRAATTE